MIRERFQGLFCNDQDLLNFDEIDGFCFYHSKLPINVSDEVPIILEKTLSGRFNPRTINFS